jgi:hypothetical protein
MNDQIAENMSEAAERIREIADQIDELVAEASLLTRSAAPERFEGFKAYVFDHILEHVRKSNRYNQDLNDVADYFESQSEIAD